MTKYPSGFEIKDIKCVILDFDNTMYYSTSIRTAHLSYLKLALTSLGRHSNEHADTLMQAVGFTHGNPHLPAFSANLDTFGITKQQWLDFTAKNFYTLDPEIIQTIPNEYYHKLAKRYPLYIVTNEYKDNIIKKAKLYNIDLSPFKLYCSASAGDSPSKKQIYSEIIADLNISPHNTLSIGDRLKVDIDPLLELGGKGILVRNTDELKAALDELLV